MGHLNGILARVGGNLNKNFQKSQIPGGLPGGGHVEASISPIHYLDKNLLSTIYLSLGVKSLSLVKNKRKFA